MALFSKKSDNAKTDAKEVVTAESKAATSSSTSGSKPVSTLELLPRLSEKALAANGLNKYVFKVATNANKIEIRKAVESQYGVNVAAVNIVRIAGKSRRYGRTTGRMSDYKKAIITLTADSKKIDLGIAA